MTAKDSEWQCGGARLKRRWVPGTRRTPLAGGAGCGAVLGGHAGALVQKLRGKIRVVGPNQRVKLRVHAELPEEFQIPKRFKYRAGEFRLEINFADRSVPEPQSDDEARNIFGFYHVVVHVIYTSGAIFFNAL